jgi:peptide/nickel transport system permease protein
MLVYVVRRLLLAALVFVAVSFLSFVVLASPLDPLWKKYGPSNSPERIAEAHKYHLKDPVVERYWLWAKGTITGTPSFVTHTVCGGRPGQSACHHLRIWPQVWTATRRTALLAGLSIVVILFFSLAIGTIAAARHGSALDVGLRSASYLAWSIPAFVVAVLLQLLLTRLATAYDFRPFPVSGLPLYGEAGTGFHFVLIWAQHLALPVFAISAGFIGAYSRYVRSAMLVSLNEPYAVTARAKGLTERAVVLRHALRNSLIPFVSILTLDFGALFGATLVADFVFKQQGLAAFLAQTTYDADPFELQPLVLVGAVSVLLFSLLGDLVAARLDPRIRFAD